MARKRGFVLKVMAVVSAAAIVFYHLIRKYGAGDVVNIVTDKISNMFLPGSSAARIYEAALQRLQIKFNADQAELLARLMVAQSKHETGNYTSNVLRNNANAFGYKYTKQSSYQIAKGSISPELNSYGKYKDVADSAREVADWLGRKTGNVDRKPVFAAVTNTQQYAEALKKFGYYGDPVAVYAGGLKRFFEQA